ncbi:short-chain dehydrogenase [Salmonella bongori]|nr:short-chain dehydrogenase [Salmonella bongori]
MRWQPCPPETLLELPLVKEIDDSLYAYQISKRGNALRVMAEAVKWGKRGARINCISAGIVFTPLAYDELTSTERGDFYRNMLEKSPAGRGGTPDEIGALAEFLFGPAGTYISGSDILIDGGVTASYKYGELRPLNRFCLHKKLHSKWAAMSARVRNPRWQYCIYHRKKRCWTATVRP